MKKLLISLLILINIMITVPAIAQSSLPATSVRTSDGSNVQLKINALSQSAATNTSEINLIYDNLGTHETAIGSLKLDISTLEVLALANKANLDTHETELTNIKLNLNTHESYLLALNNNIATHETAITDLQLNIDTLEALALANKANLDTHELLLNAKLNITAMTTHENLLTAHGLPSRAGNGAKYLYLTTDENSLIWSPLAMPDLSPYAIKATTDSLEINFLAHKDAIASAHAASAISYTDTYTLGVTTLQAYADTMAVWLTDVQNRVASIEVTLTGGSTGEVFTRTITGYIWATIPAGVTDHLLLTNIGILTHDQIDSAIAALQANPGGITKMYGGIGDLIGVTGEVGIISGTGIAVARTGNTIEVSATSSGSGATVEAIVNLPYSARSQGGAASGFYRIFDFTVENGLVVPFTQAIADNGIVKFAPQDYALSTWDNAGTPCVRVTMTYDIDETSTVSLFCFTTLPLTAVISANTVSTTSGWLQDELDNIYTKTETDLTVEVKIGAATAEINIGNYSTTAQMNSAIASATSETQAKIWYPLNMAYNDYTGEVIVDGMAASATVGQCLYLASGGWTVAKADAIGTLPAYGLCVETGTGNRKVLTRGIVRNNGWSFTKGNRIYVSPSTAGAITATRPTTGGQFIQAIGVALSADTVYFKFDDTVAGL